MLETGQSGISPEGTPSFSAVARRRRQDSTPIQHRVVHPFTAPWVMPLTKLRWNSRYITTIGAMTMMLAAESRGMFVEYSPTKKPRPAGAVRFIGSAIITSTSRNWFQDHMKSSTHSVVMAGQEMGS